MPTFIACIKDQLILLIPFEHIRTYVCVSACVHMTNIIKEKEAINLHVTRSILCPTGPIGSVSLHPLDPCSRL